ncbi:hypothetical protein BDZ45DRAFT_688990 [Acephala macrosclerotiorum]|nr:hypothetical protein BDZ45DRAFT_688990 [Acephala macrosclerotiorum]
MESNPKVNFRFPPKKPAAMVSQIDKVVESHIVIIGTKENQTDLKRLTPHWAQTHESQWPHAADTRLYRFLHEQNQYHRVPEVLYLTRACQVLVIGTMLEGCQASIHDALLCRVAKRMQQLHDDMVSTGIIELRNGHFQKTREFHKVWQARSEYWLPAMTTEAESNKRSLGDEASPDESTIKVWDQHGTGRSTKSKNDLMIPESAPTSPLSIDSYRVSPSLSERDLTSSNKRQKVSIEKRLQQKPQQQTTSFSSTTQLIQDTTASSRPVKIVLSSQVKPPTPPETPERSLNSSAIETPPFTPATPPSRTPNRLTHEGHMIDSPTMASRTPGWARPKFSSSSEKALVPAPSPPPKKVTRPVTIFIFIKTVAGTYDLENPVPATVLRDSSVQQFFEVFARRSGIPADEIKSLKFNHKFQGRKVDVIPRWYSAEEWEKFKKDLRERVSVTKQENENKTKFRILVSAGNDTTSDSDEDFGGL